MKEALINKFCEDPIEFSIAVAILIIAIGILFKLVGNPFSYFAKLFPDFVKEVTGKKGMTGFINAVIVILSFLFGMSIVFYPNIISFFKIAQDSVSRLYSLIIFLIVIVAGFASLRIVSDNEKLQNLYFPPKKNNT